MEEIIRQYAETLPDGSVLKDIAYVTIAELQRNNPFAKDKKRLGCASNSKGCIHIPTDQKYPSIFEAALDLNINRIELTKDINRRIFKYGVYLL